MTLYIRSRYPDRFRLFLSLLIHLINNICMCIYIHLACVDYYPLNNLMIIVFDLAALLIDV